jgi:UDP-2,4-diacetamido-2,4,6-trideoxy-beta-L-altropyranose hydrolase
MNGNFKIKNILVFFGGVDVKSSCIKLARTLSEKELTQYKFTFILNKTHSTFNELTNWAGLHYEMVKILPFVENMAKVMTEHDFFIGAGGSTSWERVCLGIPSAIVSVAENQTKISESLNKLGLVYYLGEDRNVDTESWREFFENKITQFEMFQEMSRRCFRLVDGKGACKLASEIVEDLK